MTEIILHNKSATMQVNTIGGYIDSLILKGREVLFPKTSVYVGDDTKLRGGMHVCLPQFGPDSKNHLPNMVSAELQTGKSVIKMNRISA